MAVLTAFATPMVYKLDYSFGESDLIKYAQLAKEGGNTISAYKTGNKYSLLYYSDLNHIDFHREDTLWLEKELEKENNLLIVRNKELDKLRNPYTVSHRGIKYSIITKPVDK